MGFMDGPFGFAPQRKQPGLFNQPSSPTANASPPVEAGGGSAPQPFSAAPPSGVFKMGGGGRVVPGGGGAPAPVTANSGPMAAPKLPSSASPVPMNGGPLAVPKTAPGGLGGPTPAGGGLNATVSSPAAPAPYSYSGPSMRLLGSGQQVRDLTAPRPAPAPSPVFNFGGTGSTGGGFMDGVFKPRIPLWGDMPDFGLANLGLMTM